MTSEIKVDTISEQTSANGVTIDGLTIKDGNIIGDVALAGTTPTFTIGDAGAEDAALIFDGNAQDFYIALDDSADDLIIGLGAAVGTTPMLSFTEAKAAAFTGAVTMASTLGVTGAVTANAGVVVDNITIDGTEIDLSSGDLTLDSAGDIILDADGGDIRFKDGGTEIGVFENSSSDLQIKAAVQDKDMIFRGNDGGAGINALVLDMSAAGAATFNAGITAQAASTITTADNTDTLSLISTDADASVGPNLVLYRNSGSPAVDDHLGKIAFQGENDADQILEYFSIRTYISDETDGTEDGHMQIVGITAGASKKRLDLTPTEAVFNDDELDIDFRVESSNNANMFKVDAGNNRVGIGTGSPATQLHLANTAGIELRLDADTNNSGQEDCFIKFSTDGGGQLGIAGMDNNNSSTLFSGNTENAMVFGTISNLPTVFATNNTERMQILSSGELLIGKSVTTFTTPGITFGNTTGEIAAVTASSAPIFLNRQNDDGGLVAFYQANSNEGSISVSGTTVSYNAFTGSHWSRLADNSKPTILRGTIMDSIDEMCDWYQAVADVAEVNYTAEDQAVIDGGKNVGDVKTEAHKIIEEIALPSDKSVGDAVTFTSNGVEYTGKYVKEGDVKHVHSKISDSADSNRVYGVFHCWNNDNVADVNDMEIAQVGTYIIRVHKDVTVSAGDLLVSNGDGTAKKQDDDIIRSKTVAKVNSNVKIETYSDGSYTVPCTLHC